VFGTLKGLNTSGEGPLMVVHSPDERKLQCATAVDKLENKIRVLLEFRLKCDDHLPSFFVLTRATTGSAA
jgi:hypothetical protein